MQSSEVGHIWPIQRSREKPIEQEGRKVTERVVRQKLLDVEGDGRPKWSALWAIVRTLAFIVSEIEVIGEF